MNLLDRLESKLGRFAIPNLMGFLALGQAIFLALSFARPEVIGLITFNRDLVLGREPWRALSFLLLPPPGSGILTFFVIYMNWWMGTALESSWGAFRFNVFYFTGVLAHIALGLAMPQLPVTPYYLNLSLFFAFATLFPNMEMLLFFILPVKVKWLGYLSAGFLVYTLVTSNLYTNLLIGISLLNYVLFFAPEAWRRLQQSRQVAENRSVFVKAEAQVSRLPVKRCKTCNATVATADIRLCDCPRCGEDGQFWCTEHLKEHLKQA